MKRPDWGKLAWIGAILVALTLAVPISQTLWSERLGISGSVKLATRTFTPTPTATATATPTPTATIAAGTSIQAEVFAAGFWTLLESGETLIGATGVVTVTNVGSRATIGLRIFNAIGVRDGNQFVSTWGQDVDLSARPVLGPGQTGVYAFRITFSPPAGATLFRDEAFVTILNHSGHLPGGPHCDGPAPCPFGPIPKIVFTLTAAPSLATPTPIPPSGKSGAEARGPGEPAAGTATATATPKHTATATRTGTPSPSATPTTNPTSTATPSATATPSSPGPEAPSATPANTGIVASTATLVGTAPSRGGAVSPTPTLNPTATETSTPAPTPTASETPPPTPTHTLPPPTPAPTATNTPEAIKGINASIPADYSCESGQWTFVVMPVPTRDSAPSYIQVSWSNGQQRNVSLSSFAGGAARYVTSLCLDSEVASAWTSIAGEWSGVFTLTSGPCANPTAGAAGGLVSGIVGAFHVAGG